MTEYEEEKSLETYRRAEWPIRISKVVFLGVTSYVIALVGAYVFSFLAGGYDYDYFSFIDYINNFDEQNEFIFCITIPLILNFVVLFFLTKKTMSVKLRKWLLIMVFLGLPLINYILIYNFYTFIPFIENYWY